MVSPVKCQHLHECQQCALVVTNRQFEQSWVKIALRVTQFINTATFVTLTLFDTCESDATDKFYQKIAKVSFIANIGVFLFDKFGPYSKK